MRFWTVQTCVSFAESSNLASLSNWKSLKQSVPARCGMFHCHRRDWPSGCKHCSRSRALDALGKETWDTMPMNAASSSTLQDASEDIWSDPWGDWIQARFTPPDSMMVHHPPHSVWREAKKMLLERAACLSTLVWVSEPRRHLHWYRFPIQMGVSKNGVCMYIYIYYIHITQMAILIIEIQYIIYVYIYNIYI